MNEAAPKLPDNFRQRVKRELVDLCASQLDLAKASKIPYGRLQHLLSGTRIPRPFEVEAIREGFNRLGERRG